jgi:tRNA A-37 threonylcarbamoyl transferase component Bud32
MGQAVLLAPGTLLCGRYQVEHLIAAGGMAEVYAAVDRRLERSVAVKMVRTADIDVAERLARESTILARLDHPGIVRVFDVDEHDDMPFLVMELIDGPSLDRVLQDGPLAREQVAAIAEALADALVHAHDLGIVHRDIKPSNVLIEGSGRPRLADFGIARATDATSVTATGVALGSAAYVAPEQLSDERITAAADVYSTGLVLLECLTGRRQFDGSPSEAALARLQRDPEVPDDLGAPWSELLVAMTRRDPAERPTAVEVARRLGAPAEAVTAEIATEIATGAEAAPTATAGPTEATVALEVPDGTEVMPTVGPTVGPTVRPTEPPPPRPALRSRPWFRPALVGGAALLVVVLLATVLLGRGDGGDPPPPVSDESLVAALEDLEAVTPDRLQERVANIKRAVFVDQVGEAARQLTALAVALDRQVDAEAVTLGEADATLSAIGTVMYELATLPE